MKQYRLSFILSLLFICSGSMLWAQSKFTVLASSGATRMNGKVLGVGTTVPTNAVISVSPQSYISLVHSNNGTVEISKPGTYQVKTLEAELLKRAKQSTSQRFANYIIGELTKQGGQDIHKNPYKYQNVTGSVERSLPGDIIIQLPKTSAAFYNQYPIEWFELENAESYTITMKDDFGEVAKTINTRDTALTLNLNDKELQESGMVIITISSVVPGAGKDSVKTSIDCAITRLEPNKVDDIKKKYKAAKFDDNSLIGKLNQAFFFEQNKLLVDAMNKYREALLLSPDSEVFKIAYNQFLIRHSIGVYFKYKEEDNN